MFLITWIWLFQEANKIKRRWQTGHLGCLYWWEFPWRLSFVYPHKSGQQSSAHLSPHKITLLLPTGLSSTLFPKHTKVFSLFDLLIVQPLSPSGFQPQLLRETFPKQTNPYSSLNSCGMCCLYGMAQPRWTCLPNKILKLNKDNYSSFPLQRDTSQHMLRCWAQSVGAMQAYFLK